MLSDGQQNVVNIVLETVYRMAMLNPDKFETLEDGRCVGTSPGVLMIDELDMHLHVEWQETIVDSLKKCFPNIQIFATTHSPKLIQSVSREELVHLEGLEPEIDPKMMSVNSILADLQDTDYWSNDFVEIYKQIRPYHTLLNEWPNASEERRLELSVLLDLQEQEFDNPAALYFLQQKRQAVTGTNNETGR